ncbi:Prolyl oligopeptidase family protein [Euphorbia peplus]|nr:Prolyl oligopeptidase family protein [Euphorbia peplus]
MAFRALRTSKPWLRISILGICSSFSSQCSRSAFSSPSQTQSPPLANKVPFTVSAHGKTWHDPYHWMHNTTHPDFINYLHQENSYAQSFMSDTLILRQTLFHEMQNRVPALISTPPERWGPWLYSQYIPQGKQYPVLCRRLESGKRREQEQILLDWNQIAEQYGYVHVGSCRVSPDHNFLAYTLDITGNEQFILQIKDLRNGKAVPRSETNVVSLAWAQDSETLFYTIPDENQRPYRVVCTKLGSEEINDVPVYTESDSSFCVDITSTKDGKFITVYVIDATKPLNGLQRIHKRVSGVQFFLEHHHNLYYILSNAPSSGWEGESYYLATCGVEHIHMSKWKNIIFPSEDMYFQDMDIFNGHLVISLQKKGLPMLCSINLPIKVDNKSELEIEDLQPWFFPLPSNQCSIVPGSNHDFMNSVYRVVVSSPVMPDVIVDYEMSKQTFSVVQQEEVRGMHNDHGTCLQNHDIDVKDDGDQNGHSVELRRWKDFSNTYYCERKEAVSHDGVRIPLTILYSQKSWQRELSPGLLQGYGAYGEVLDKSWCADRVSLLDRGWVLAFADVRGGGEGDLSWHKSGSGLNKLNSMYDFISCGDYLINEGYVHKDKLTAIGYSAGGLLVGAAINMNPSLFRAAILKVPFVDICNTLLDPSLPLTLLDYEEFGNPEMQSEFEYIRSYSPYDNIPQNVCLPSMLVTASYLDSRVGVWEAAKWVARIRDSSCENCSKSVILKTDMRGGHFGEGGLLGRSEETAYDYAFLIKIIGNLTDFVKE